MPDTDFSLYNNFNTAVLILDSSKIIVQAKIGTVNHENILTRYWSIKKCIT